MAEPIENNATYNTPQMKNGGKTTDDYKKNPKVRDIVKETLLREKRLGYANYGFTDPKYPTKYNTTNDKDIEKAVDDAIDQYYTKYKLYELPLSQQALSFDFAFNSEDPRASLMVAAGKITPQQKLELYKTKNPRTGKGMLTPDLVDAEWEKYKKDVISLDDKIDDAFANEKIRSYGSGSNADEWKARVKETSDVYKTKFAPKNINANTNTNINNNANINVGANINANINDNINTDINADYKKEDNTNIYNYDMPKQEDNKVLSNNKTVQNTTENNVLDGIQSKVGDQSNVTTDGIYSYEPSASSEEIAAMNAPGSPDLKPQDYFPDLNERTLQGTYSGPTIGTVSLFAPGGGLTPYTVIDAREKALEAAALKKAKQIEDFNKLYGEPPVTKHSSVQKELNKVYFDGLNNWVTNSQKKYGDNWAQALKNDLSFQSWVRDANTLKEQEDYLVNEKANIEKDISSGRFVETPELRKALNDFDAGVSGLAQGKLAPTGYNLANSIATMSAEYDLAKSINESIEPVKYGLAESFGVNRSDPNYDQIVSTKMQEVPDQTLKDLAVQLKREKYFDSKNITEDMIFNRMRSMFPKKKEVTVQTASKRKPEEGGEFQYKETDREDDPIGTNVWVNMGKGQSPKQGEVLMEYQYGHKKPIPGFLPQNTKVYLNDEKNGLIPSNDVDPNQEVVYGRTGLLKVYNKPGSPLDGTPLTKDQIKQKLPSRWQAMTQGKIGKGRVTTTVTTPDGEEQRITYKEETTFWTPTKQISNQLVTQRGANGNIIRGVPVDDVQEEENRRNSTNKVQGQQQTQTKTQQKQGQQGGGAPKEGDTKTLSSGKVAIFRNGQWQLK